MHTQKKKMHTNTQKYQVVTILSVKLQLRGLSDTNNTVWSHGYLGEFSTQTGWGTAWERGLDTKEPCPATHTQTTLDGTLHGTLDATTGRLSLHLYLYLYMEFIKFIGDEK
eukprot:GEMP01050987.1.p1 GENE.GEMP01050987.1~~GEMP01050987.1.p1  ORF type:complete len:111 (-),score=2.07 GEMP01050987.1:1115-1447(-)